jgi:hypothetical protein
LKDNFYLIATITTASSFSPLTRCDEKQKLCLIAYPPTCHFLLEKGIKVPFLFEIKLMDFIKSIYESTINNFQYLIDFLGPIRSCEVGKTIYETLIERAQPSEMTCCMRMNPSSTHHQGYFFLSESNCSFMKIVNSFL